MAGLTWLDGEVARAEARLEQYIQADIATARLLQLPGGRPAPGIVTARVLRAELGRFARFDTGRSLSRFAGLSPRNASSGQRQAGFDFRGAGLG